MGNADNLPQKLIAGPYATRALVPSSPWLDSVPPLSPIVRSGWDATHQASTLSLVPQGSEPTWLWVIRAHVGDNWTTDIVPGLQRFYTLPSGLTPSPDAVSVSSVDRTGNESTPVEVGLAVHPLQ
jgi:hypothetical protein